MRVMPQHRIAEHVSVNFLCDRSWIARKPSTVHDTKVSSTGSRANAPAIRERRSVVRQEGYQLFFKRYFSCQPPQSFLQMLPNAALKEFKSFTQESAAFASLPSLASLALKSSMFFQISGLAVYGSSVVASSRNKAGALTAVTSNVAKIL